MKYIPPKTIAEWKVDEPNKELYIVSIKDNRTVVSAYGRYAHGSGHKAVSWEAFLAGEMNELVEKKMGKEILDDLLQKLRSIT